MLGHLSKAGRQKLVFEGFCKYYVIYGCFPSPQRRCWQGRVGCPASARWRR